MAIVLALAAALGWGASDFAAGRASRRAPVAAVVVLTYLTSALIMAALSIRWPSLGVALRWGTAPELGVFSLHLGRPALSGAPALSDLLWGAAAGVGGGVGAALLFRGLSRGSAAVVAPVTALGGAAVPLLWGVSRGDALGVGVQLGLVLALTAIVLVSMAAPARDAAADAADDGAGGAGVPEVLARADHPERAPRRAAVPVLALSLLAGSAALAAPMLLARWQGVALSPPAFAVIGAAAVVVAISMAAAELRAVAPASVRPAGRCRPTARGDIRRRRRGRRPTIPIGLPEAVLAGLGFGSFFVFIDHTGGDAGLWPLVSARGASVVLFVAAARWGRAAVLPGPGARGHAVLAGVGDAAAAVLYLWAAQAGLLSIAVVLASLYPGVTVLLSRFVDGEALSRRQWAGLALAGGAIALLVVGP